MIFDFLITINSNIQGTNLRLYYNYIRLNKHKTTEKASNKQSNSSKAEMRFLITYNKLSCSNHEPRTILWNLHRFTNPRPSKMHPAPTWSCLKNRFLIFSLFFCIFMNFLLWILDWLMKLLKAYTSFLRSLYELIESLTSTTNNNLALMRFKRLKLKFA